MLVAILALFLAAGGVGYAATSVGSAQITNNSIRSADVRDGPLAPRDLSAKARATLRGTDGVPGKKGGRGTTGARGLEGLTGPVGPASAAGATNVVVRTNSVSLVAGTTGTPTVQCEPGERATGGGGGVVPSLPGTRALVQSGPVDVSGTLPIANGAVPTGWRVEALNNSGQPTPLNAFVYAVCAAP